jgi:hypothetical protein
MKLNPKTKLMLIKLIPILLIVLFAIAVFYHSYEFDCGESKSCYDRHMETCKRTKLTTYDEGSTFIYQIERSQGGNCVVEITLASMAEEADQDSQLLFEGKSMTCAIPKGTTFNAETLPYCTGPLKEAIYELTIQKMYNILAQSLGDIMQGL